MDNSAIHPRIESRENNIDFLRVALAVSVMFSHSFSLRSGSNATEPLVRLTGNHETFGSVGVAGFFILSGFLISRSWFNSRGLLRFGRRRIARIYPGVVAAILFAAFVVAPIAGSSFISHRDFLKRVLIAIRYVDEPVIPGTFATNPLPGSLNGSLWTILYELGCYAMVAGLGLAGILRRPRLVLLCFVLSLALYATADASHVYSISRLMPVFSHRLAPVAAPRLFALFLAGVCFGAYEKYVPLRGGVAIACILAIAAAQFCGTVIAHLAFAVLAAYPLFYLAFSDRVPFQNFAKYGDFSYGLYLYAWPVTQIIVRFSHAKIPSPVLFFLVLVGTFPLAAASWYVVERPFLKRKRARPEPQRVRQVEVALNPG